MFTKLGTSHVSVSGLNLRTAGALEPEIPTQTYFPSHVTWVPPPDTEAGKE